MADVQQVKQDVQQAKQQVEQYKQQIGATQEQLARAQTAYGSEQNIRGVSNLNQLAQKQQNLSAISAGQEQLAAQQKAVQSYSSDIGKVEAQVKSYEDKQRAVESVQRAIDKGMVWAVAAFGSGLEQKYAKQYLKDVEEAQLKAQPIDKDITLPSVTKQSQVAEQQFDFKQYANKYAETQKSQLSPIYTSTQKELLQHYIGEHWFPLTNPQGYVRLAAAEITRLTPPSWNTKLESAASKFSVGDILPIVGLYEYATGKKVSVEGTIRSAESIATGSLPFVTMSPALGVSTATAYKQLEPARIPEAATTIVKGQSAINIKNQLIGRPDLNAEVSTKIDTASRVYKTTGSNGLTQYTFEQGKMVNEAGQRVLTGVTINEQGKVVSQFVGQAVEDVAKGISRINTRFLTSQGKGNYQISEFAEKIKPVADTGYTSYLGEGNLNVLSLTPEEFTAGKVALKARTTLSSGETRLISSDLFTAKELNPAQNMITKKGSFAENILFPRDISASEINFEKKFASGEPMGKSQSARQMVIRDILKLETPTSSEGAILFSEKGIIKTSEPVAPELKTSTRTNKNVNLPTPKPIEAKPIDIKPSPTPKTSPELAPPTTTSTDLGGLRRGQSSYGSNVMNTLVEEVPSVAPLSNTITEYFKVTAPQRTSVGLSIGAKPVLNIGQTGRASSIQNVQQNNLFNTAQQQPQVQTIIQPQAQPVIQPQALFQPQVITQIQPVALNMKLEQSQQLKLEQKQEQKQNQNQTNQQQTPVKPSVTSFAFSGAPVSKSALKSAFTKLSGQFEVFVRRKKKDIKIGTESSKELAAKSLSMKLKSDLSASGFIVEKSTGRKLSFAEVGLNTREFRPAKKDLFRVVQREGQRLSSRSEVKEIQLFKKQKGKTGRSLFGF